jgi:hypothetical protein
MVPMETPFGNVTNLGHDQAMSPDHRRSGSMSGPVRSGRRNRPQVHPEAYVAPTALLTGHVQVAAGTSILDGAIVTAESAPVRIGAECVVMEHGKHSAHSRWAVAYAPGVAG